ERDRTGRDDLDRLDLAAVEPHDRARAELLVDGADRLGDALVLLVVNRLVLVRHENLRAEAFARCVPSQPREIRRPAVRKVQPATGVVRNPDETRTDGRRATRS